MDQFILIIVVIVVPVASIAYAAGKYGIGFFFD